SSVPNGCAQLGPCNCAVKSMSLICTRHSNGPNSTARIMADRITELATARRWRRKRRHASVHGVTWRAGGLRRAATGAPSAVGDAWVEPAIQQIRDQVEQDDQAGEDKRD